jgi:hypothetical protein
MAARDIDILVSCSRAFTQYTVAKRRCWKVSDADKLNWHIAFLRAIQLEFYEYLGDLEITPEYQLTSEPMRVDVLIVKKKKDIVIDKGIARIFRGYNIFEYKSPDDSFSARDFWQVCAYANHYAANTRDVVYEDLSLTFIGARYPRELIRYLIEVRGYTIEESILGIYQVRGDHLPIQIVESKKLHESEKLWLKALTNKLSVDSARAILEEESFLDAECKALAEAYLGILVQTNSKNFKEVNNMAKRYPTLDEVMEEMGRPCRRQGLEEGEERAKQKIVRNLLGEGMPIEKIARLAELPIEKVQELAAEALAVK